MPQDARAGKRGRQGEPSTENQTDRPEPVSGPGALCAEAQADGVPCTELGRDCEECERAVAQRTSRIG